MSDRDELTADGEAYRQEVCLRLAHEIMALLPELPIPVESVQQMIYDYLGLELFDYDETRTRPHRREAAELQRRVIRAVVGGLPQFGESLDALAEEGRGMRRVNNAAALVAQDVFAELNDMLRTGPKTSHSTGPIAHMAERQVRANRIRLVVFAATSLLGSAGIWTAFVFGALTLRASIICEVIGIAATWGSTRSFDRHDHK